MLDKGKAIVPCQRIGQHIFKARRESLSFAMISTHFVLVQRCIPVYNPRRTGTLLKISVSI